ncbi:MAG: HEAT repeat protein [Planctomycetota bacterium]|jgi:HEAT repeat protein
MMNRVKQRARTMGTSWLGRIVRPNSLRCCGQLLAMVVLPLAAGDAHATHGGVYRGPGGAIGPGGAKAGGGPGAGSTAGAANTDTSAWSQWWGFNRERYMSLRSAVRSGTAATGSDEFYLGHGTSSVSREGLMPSNAQIRNLVVPALMRALKSRDNDILTASLLALAKIGQDAAGTGFDLSASIRAFLTHSNQEVHETAAVALGILANSSTAPDLAALLHDTEHGRKLVARAKVSTRTRAYAAYGLGLIGNRAESPSVRGYAVHHLAAVLETREEAALDVGVAAVLSLGLIPLLDGELPGPESPPVRPGASRQAQVLFLLGKLADDGPKGLDSRVRAQIPVAVVRLARGASPSVKTVIGKQLVDALKPRTKLDKAVSHGVVHALGLLGDNDEDPVDVAIRKRLFETASNGDRTSRHIALVALARCATRPGESLHGPGPELVRQFLLGRLKGGSSLGRPWAALSLGLFEHGNQRHGYEPSNLIRTALRLRFQNSASPAEAGALAIALGLAGDRSATDSLVERLHGGDENVRGHAAAALGMMGAVSAIDDLRMVVSKSGYRPGVLRECAIALAMLGDKESVSALLNRIGSTSSLLEQIGVLSALGRVGDARSVDGLINVLNDERKSDLTRAFGAVALGVICAKESLPWNAKIAADIAWWETPATLIDPTSGKGILDLY